MAQRSRQGRTPGKGTGPRGPDETEGQAARRRTRARNTKSPGLVVRENEERQARAELKTIRSTGVANNTQISRASAAVDRASAATERQRKTARGQGRPDR